MDIDFLIAGSVFVLFLSGGLLALYYYNRSQKLKEITLRIREETLSEQEIGKTQLTPNFILEAVKRFGLTLRPKDEAGISKTKKRLLRAGLGEKDVLLFYGGKVLGGVLLPLLFLVIKIAAFPLMPSQKVLQLFLLFVLAGFYLPDLYLRSKTNERKKKIFEGFPDALDLMVVCVEAGMSLDAAIKRVGDEMALKNKVLSDEFKLLSIELRAGKPRPEALRNLAMRTDVEDVSSLVTLLIQTDRFGTRVGQALRVHSDSMRTKRYQRAEEIAAKMPIKILFPLVFFILPALLITMVGPAALKFYRVMVRGGSIQW